MSCNGCGTSSLKPNGCNSNGACTTGSCNRLNTFDWLEVTDFQDFSDYDTIEVSFKNGSRKDFYQLPRRLHVDSGDMVVVDSGSGYDVGRVSLTGELVRLQMKKKNIKHDRILQPVVRKANHRDMEKLVEARALEKQTMVRSRAIARMLDLDMKVGDVEYQGDKRKATFYFTANGRVDFRELIRHYAKEFRVKIEMRQIGSRQESSRIGGLGSCGRELCCSTWLTNFKSVSTKAARYQNLSINQSKLSGQCGRLKCCLNYELDLYMEAIDSFPVEAETIKTKKGNANLIKVDIFKKVMYYSHINEVGRAAMIPLSIERVKYIKAKNRQNLFPDDFIDKSAAIAEAHMDFADVTGGVELKDPKGSNKSGKRRYRKGKSRYRPSKKPRNNK
jgi:cell fate regulator YaaT (PSP1 superfamily)